MSLGPTIKWTGDVRNGACKLYYNHRIGLHRTIVISVCCTYKTGKSTTAHKLS